MICIGEWAYAETPGNIPDLTLPDAQLHLALKIMETKKPVILVLTEGRPRIISRIAEAAKAIVMAYNPSNEGGQAIADVLFGDVNPSGKLPITYPRSANHLFTYDHKVFEGEDWGEGKALAAAQFEFGSGLSYTTFSYSDLRCAGLGFGEPVRARGRDGEEQRRPRRQGSRSTVPERAFCERDAAIKAPQALCESLAPTWREPPRLFRVDVRRLVLYRRR